MTALARIVVAVVTWRAQAKASKNSRPGAWGWGSPSPSAGGHKQNGDAYGLAPASPSVNR